MEKSRTPLPDSVRPLVYEPVDSQPPAKSQLLSDLVASLAAECGREFGELLFAARDLTSIQFSVCIVGGCRFYRCSECRLIQTSPGFDLHLMLCRTGRTVAALAAILGQPASEFLAKPMDERRLREEENAPEVRAEDFPLLARALGSEGTVR